MKILIVKTSALGDILQSLCAVTALKSKFPQAEIDFVVEESLSSVVLSHPLISEVIKVPFKSSPSKMSFVFFQKFFAFAKNLRKKRYDVVFDFQGNCKSGIVNVLARAKQKVGYSFSSVREWPNFFTCNYHYPVKMDENISRQMLTMLEQHLQVLLPLEYEQAFLMDCSQELVLQDILKEKKHRFTIVFAVGAKWENKQLDVLQWIALIEKIQLDWDVDFFAIWGSEKEKAMSLQIARACFNVRVLPTVLSMPCLQKLIQKSDFFLGVDSSLLHLAAMTKTPSFSFFGPTAMNVFRPQKSNHFGFQGVCPYNQSFNKLCPKLRKCSTGACLKNLALDEMIPQVQEKVNLTFSSKSQKTLSRQILD